MARVRNALLGRISRRRHESQCADCRNVPVVAITRRADRAAAAGRGVESAAAVRFIFLRAYCRSPTPAGDSDRREPGSCRLHASVPESANFLGGYFFMTVAANGIWQKNPALAWREIENETVIISPAESVMHELNDTGSLLWRSIDGRRSAEDLAALLAEQYEVPAQVALADTLELLDELSRRRLLITIEHAPGEDTA